MWQQTMCRNNIVTHLNAARIDYDRLIALAQSEFEMLEICSRIGAVHGAPLYSLLKFPKSADDPLSTLSIVSNWPAKLISEYDRLELFHNSPVLEHLRQSTEPLIFDIREINRNRVDNREEEAVKLFKKFSILHGAYFSVHDVSGQMGAVSFCGPNPVFDDDTVMKLNYFANLIYSKFLSLRSEKADPKFSLKARELKLLQYVSEGKNLSEIGQMMGISETLVSRYLQNASLKLGCTSMIHTVSKALRLGLIS